MAALLPRVKLFLGAVFLGAAALLIAQWFKPPFFSVVILIYSGAALVLFLGTALYMIFSRLNR